MLRLPGCGEPPPSRRRIGGGAAFPGADSRAAPCGASGRAAGGAAVVLEWLSPIAPPGFSLGWTGRLPRCSDQGGASPAARNRPRLGGDPGERPGPSPPRTPAPVPRRRPTGRSGGSRRGSRARAKRDGGDHWGRTARPPRRATTAAQAQEVGSGPARARPRRGSTPRPRPRARRRRRVEQHRAERAESVPGVRPRADQGLPLGEHQPGRLDLVDVDLPGPSATSSAAETPSEALAGACLRRHGSGATPEDLSDDREPAPRRGCSRRPRRVAAMKEQPSDHRVEEAVLRALAAAGRRSPVPDCGQSVSPPLSRRLPAGDPPCQPPRKRSMRSAAGDATSKNTAYAPPHSSDLRGCTALVLAEERASHHFSDRQRCRGCPAGFPTNRSATTWPVCSTFLESTALAPSRKRPDVRRLARRQPGPADEPCGRGAGAEARRHEGLDAGPVLRPRRGSSSTRSTPTPSPGSGTGRSPESANTMSSAVRGADRGSLAAGEPRRRC